LTKPSIYNAFVNNFTEMWSDTTNYGPLVTTPPRTVDLTLAGTSPTPNQTGVSVATSFTWNAAPWATSYDVWLGTTGANMQKVGTVDAVQSTNPPSTYSWTLRHRSIRHELSVEGRRADVREHDVDVRHQVVLDTCQRIAAADGARKSVAGQRIGRRRHDGRR